MQMPPEYGERSLLAIFQSSSSAVRAVEELNAMGYGAVQVERISSYHNETFTGMTLFADDGDSGLIDGTLTSSDPSVNVCLNDDLVGGRAFLVAAVNDHLSVDLAAQILKKHGGHL